MLHVYHSNRLEALFILMCTLRESSPLPDPLTPETVLVANPGIGRWLNFQFADRDGIAANIDYVLPAAFVWQLYRNCLENVPEKSAFERNALRLRVLGHLDAIGDESDQLWSPLQRYIGTDDGTVGDTKRVQLASRIADVFDQYLVYRPQMLLDWERGSDSTPGNDPAQRWQPALWRRLSRSVDEPHRATLWRQFCTLADAGGLAPASLPPRLQLFNVGLLPPSTLDVLVRLANVETIDSETGASDSMASERVSLYFLNPAIDYWADLLDMRRAARERLKLAAGAEPLADDKVGNALLSSLGGSGRTLLELLGDRSEWVHDEQFFLPAANDSLLAAVQADMLHPYTAPDDPAPETTSPDETHTNDSELANSSAINADPSIQLHQCYSPVREVQALHDHLLGCFNDDPTLTPADIIVMVPDINRYAPVIEAVFGSVGTEPDNPLRTRHIPWSIADRALVQASQVVACVQRLVELPGFEFEASGVLAFAAEPAIARQFGFDDNALKMLSEWLRESGVRRTLTGQSGGQGEGRTTDHNNEKILSDAEAALHSWDFGLRRLLLGRAMPQDSGAVGDTLPLPLVDGQQTVLLSRLLDLLSALADTRVKLRQEHTPSEWVDVINDVVVRFLQPDDDEADALAQFRELLIELDNDALSAGHTGPMSHAMFSEILRGALAGAQRKNHRYLTGRVTFSSMVPLRSVPFRIVCMLGLNDGDFPRQRPNPGFDLIARSPLPGDRSVRDDDRYLFLEAILSARDTLYLSWIYHNVSDNAPREASVLVSELRDYLKKRYPQQPPQVVEHPLQPFSKKLFDSERPALHSFASEWAPPVAVPEPVSLLDTGAVAENDTQISLDDFQSFWRNPSNWYCRRVLGIALWRDEQSPEDAEPFATDALSSYQLRSGLINQLLQLPVANDDTEPGHTESAIKHDASMLLQRSGVLPHGGMGELVFDEEFEAARAQTESIRAHNPVPLPVVDIHVDVNGQQLIGRLTGGVHWPDGRTGLLHYPASSLKGTHLCALWLSHLFGAAAGKLTGHSLVIAKDKERVIPAVEPADALVRLQPWLDGWNVGQASALPFFPKTSAILAGAIKGNATNTWLSSQYGGGLAESEEEAVQLLYSNVGDMLNRDDVMVWAQKLLGVPELSL